MDTIHVLHNLVSGQVHAAGLGPRGYSAVERLHKSGLIAADMWCLDAERRDTDDPQGIHYRRLQVTQPYVALSITRKSSADVRAAMLFSSCRMTSLSSAMAHCFVHCQLQDHAAH